MEANEKYVWVDLDENLCEFDPKTGEGPIIETCKDRNLIESSEACEDECGGVVVASKGVDGHWHMVRYLTRAEKRELKFTRE